MILLNLFCCLSILNLSMDLKKRINRLIGQLRGIERMVEMKRDSTEILQQISAVKKAIDGLTKEILVSDICQYIPQKDVNKVQKTLERMIGM